MSKPKSFRPWNPEQTLLLPPSPVEWLPENHLVFFLLDLAAELDLGEIHAYYRQKDPRGEKAYDPRMMVVLLLYAYCVGLPSSRKIEKACWEDAAFRVLTGNQQPDHSRISDFRRRHLSSRPRVVDTALRLPPRRPRHRPGRQAPRRRRECRPRAAGRGRCSRTWGRSCAFMCFPAGGDGAPLPPDGGCYLYLPGRR